MRSTEPGTRLREIINEKVGALTQKQWDLETALASYRCLNPPTPFEEWKAACDWLLNYGPENIKKEVRVKLNMKHSQLRLIKG